MSSSYTAMCLSHDPGIELPTEYTGHDAALDELRQGVPGHPHCDLVVATFSGAFTTMTCPPSKDRPGGASCVHAAAEPMDAGVLRLLAAAHQSDDPAMHAAIKAGHFICWPWDRLRRLSGFLTRPTF
ncbi:hypothetical protein [Streptomyces griseus]|uniref:hypothetical protein n=1 Tax=Streptomyces griseus TaxID=1911 RepID=UPI00117CAE0D|nr:hypothetical protein [Streptomyces fimicarius]